MVLKFCGMVRTDEALDASRQRRLQELLRDDSTRRSSALFKKEVRVFFDSTRPHGLAFDDGGDDDNELQSRGYACRVAAIATTGSPGEVPRYNTRCRAVGDYAHVVVEGMRVRAVDGADMKDVPFDDVVQRITAGCSSHAGCAVTFADVSSQPMSPSKTPKLRTVGNIVLAAHRAQLTKAPPSPTRSPSRSPSRSSSLTLGSPTHRARSIFNAHASPKVSKWSSVLTAVSDTVKAHATTTSTTQADVLASDLAHKNAHLEAQLLIAKGKLAALEREKAALETQCEQATREAAEQLARFQSEREALETELSDARAECTAGALRSSELERDVDTLRSEVAALHTALETLQHEHDGVVLQMHELEVEHRDVQHQTEELHARLVAAQLVKSELHEQLTLVTHQQSRDRAALAELETALRPDEAATLAAGPNGSDGDPPAIAVLRQVLRSRDALDKQLEELQIELSCHETTIQHQQDARIELEDRQAALTQINASLRDQVRTLMAAAAPPAPPETVPRATSETAVQELERQLRVERDATARIQSALQTLEDKARAKLELHEKEQLFLAQFKEQLVRGMAVKKYGARGNPHTRVLFADPQCRWVSWRDPGDGASSPRADAKAETLDLVEVMLGARSEIFAQHKPSVPARCLSLVFCHPCRTLDLEVETRERALFLRRGFSLLRDEAAEKRRRHEDDDAAGH